MKLLLKYPAALAAYVFLSLVASAFAQDMSVADVLIPDEPWTLVGEGFKFTEGPAVDREGNLYFTDVPADKIYKLDSSGKPTVFLENSQKTNGLMFGPDNKLYGCQNGARRIVAIDAAGKQEAIAEDVDSNDLVVTSQGAVYFTDPANHKVWFVSADRKKRVVAEGIERPNGIILWPDQGTLVVADTAGPRLWTFRVEPDGSLAHKEGYYTLRMVPGQKGSGADGMTVDSTGRLYVATHAGLQVFDPTGRMAGVIAKPQNAFLSNAVFAGPKLDTLYVTSADKVFSRKTKAVGIRYHK